MWNDFKYELDLVFLMRKKQIIFPRLVLEPRGDPRWSNFWTPIKSGERKRTENTSYKGNRMTSPLQWQTSYLEVLSASIPLTLSHLISVPTLWLQAGNGLLNSMSIKDETKVHCATYYFTFLFLILPALQPSILPLDHLLKAVTSKF